MRARLSKRLDDATAIRLFAEHHIAHVRRRRNGEIVAVKHVTFGWISPEAYYGLQKLHDLMPLVQEFVKGGYMAKAWLWSSSVSVAGTAIPIGAAFPAVETLNLVEEILRQPINPGMLLLRAYALLGPFGDVIQIIDSAYGLANLAIDWSKLVLVQNPPSAGAGGPMPGMQGTGAGRGGLR